jgi:hypothetical protein
MGRNNLSKSRTNQRRRLSKYGGATQPEPRGSRLCSTKIDEASCKVAPGCSWGHSKNPRSPRKKTCLSECIHENKSACNEDHACFWGPKKWPWSGDTCLTKEKWDEDAGYYVMRERYLEYDRLERLRRLLELDNQPPNRAVGGKLRKKNTRKKYTRKKHRRKKNTRKKY